MAFSPFNLPDMKIPYIDLKTQHRLLKREIASAVNRVIACQPARVAEFREGVERAIEFAKAAGCPRLNALAYWMFLFGGLKIAQLRDY